MKQKSLICLILCLLVPMSLSFTLPASGQVKPIELNYSTHFPGTAKLAILQKEWADEIGKRTNGRVKITLFYGGTLTPPDRCYEGVVNGVSDIGNSIFGLSRGRFPLTEVADLPLGITDMLAFARAFNEYFKKFQPKELDDVKVLYLYASSASQMHTKKPVYKLEDLKGMKIRSGALIAKITKALGAIPVVTPVTEAYDVLSKGVADGVLIPYEAIESFKLAEVIKFTTEISKSAAGGGHYIVMNKSKWNALPPDVQKIIEKVDEEWIDKTGKAWEELDRSGKEFSLKLGNKVIVLSKEENERWAKAVRPLLDEYVEYTKAKGLPGQEVLNFFLDRAR